VRTLIAGLLTFLALPALAQAQGDADAQSGPDAAAPGVEAPAPAAAPASRPAPADEAAAVAALEPAVNTSPRARSSAIDRLDLGTTSITGNQELPKVLYIVPWKRSDLGDLVGRPVNTLLDEVLAPVDPDVFERQHSYYETLHGETQEE
jgi:hypothetical protein